MNQEDDFSAYLEAADRGLGPVEACQLAIKNGLDVLAQIRMLRSVFGLTLIQAKSELCKARGYRGGTDEYQESLIPDLEEALNQLEHEARQVRRDKKKL